MTLIVILNVVLAIGIVSAMVALHHRAIVRDRQDHQLQGTVPVSESASVRSAPRTERPAPARRIQRPVMASD